MDKGKLVEQLKLHEGFKGKVYLDSVGQRTVGIGFNLERNDALLRLRSVGASFRGVLSGRVSLTQEQAETLLKQELDEIEFDARRLVATYDELNDVRQRVIVDMIYNLGAYGFSRFKNTIKYICTGDYENAASHMLESKWAKQVGGRARVLSNMMKYGEDVYEL